MQKLKAECRGCACLSVGLSIRKSACFISDIIQRLSIKFGISVYMKSCWAHLILARTG